MIAEVAACVDGPRRIYPDADPAAPGDSDRRELSEAQCEIENAILELGQTGKLRDEAEEVALDRELAERCP
jgi:hypothetical protein